MKKLILIGILAIFGWQAYTNNQAQQLAVEEVQEETPAADPGTIYQTPALALSKRTYACDGRIHCSQMTSCEEATFFLNTCPGTKMDGDNDGIACEQQWCN
jgi:hypothetical protein